MAMVQLEAYIDESGTSDGEPVLAVAGYVLYEGLARAMEVGWKSMLKRYALPYFHMVDCAHGAGHYSSLSRDQRIAVATNAIELIKAYTYGGFCALMPSHRFVSSAEFKSTYSTCVGHCLRQMCAAIDNDRALLATLGTEVKLSLFLEGGHRHCSEARVVAKRAASASMNMPALPTRIASIDVGGKDSHVLLQAADVLAWQCAKYVKNKLGGSRRTRADFSSLVQAPHWFGYYAMRGENTYMYSDRMPHIEGEERDSVIKDLFREIEPTTPSIVAFYGEDGSLQSRL